MLVSRKFYLSRARMLAFLDDLSKKDDSAKTLHIPAGSSPERITYLLGEIDPDGEAPKMPELAADSKTGTVIFWGESCKYLVIPPFPLVVESLDHGFVIEPLCTLLSQDREIALVLVRLGAYAVGLCRGEDFIASDAGTGNIHARHRQGGSSAKRFQRHREKQIESFLTRACSHIHSILQADAKSIDHVVYGGAQTTIHLLRQHCPFLQQFDDRCLAPLLDIAEPRRKVLVKSIQRIWSSRIIEWRMT
ncbi:MAG: hypothetical protein HYX84_04750 [Chloroflexi bacterium]|nr:hypothetical protein [Chloroflexota bacterium]